MAKTRENALTMGYHGMFGQDFIFKFRDGVSILCKIADYSKIVWTPAQRQNRINFRLAVDWAKTALKDEKTYRYYKKKVKGWQTPYNLAIGDYMKNIKLKCNLSQYDRIRGGNIHLEMPYQFGASSATVSLYGPGGRVIGSGPAKFTDRGLGYAYEVNGVGENPEYFKVTLFRGPVGYTSKFDFPKEYQ